MEKYLGDSVNYMASKTTRLKLHFLRTFKSRCHTNFYDKNLKTYHYVAQLRFNMKDQELELKRSFC